MTDTSANPPTSTGRQANGRFGPGNPGRRPGSRNRMSHATMMAILDDFDQHKRALLQVLRTRQSAKYFNTFARLAPRMLKNEIADFDGYSDAEAAGILARVRQVLADTTDPRRALEELDAVLTAQ